MVLTLTCSTPTAFARRGMWIKILGWHQKLLLYILYLHNLQLEILYVYCVILYLYCSGAVLYCT